MSPEDVKSLSSIPFLKFVIHLPDAGGLSKIRVDAAYLEVIKALASAPIRNISWKFHRTSQGEDIHSLVKDIIDTHGIPVRYFGLSDRAGNIAVPDRQQVAYKIGRIATCKDYHHNILFPNGDVGLCHMDWGLKHVIGKLTEVENYRDLYKTPAFKNLRDALTDEKLFLQCRYCEKGIQVESGVRSLFPAFLRKGDRHHNIYDE
jgi:hypothetical protein